MYCIKSKGVTNHNYCISAPCYRMCMLTHSHKAIFISSPIGSILRQCCALAGLTGTGAVQGTNLSPAVMVTNAFHPRCFWGHLRTRHALYMLAACHWQLNQKEQRFDWNASRLRPVTTEDLNHQHLGGSPIVVPHVLPVLSLYLHLCYYQTTVDRNKMQNGYHDIFIRWFDEFHNDSWTMDRSKYIWQIFVKILSWYIEGLKYNQITISHIVCAGR